MRIAIRRRGRWRWGVVGLGIAAGLGYLASCCWEASWCQTDRADGEMSMEAERAWWRVGVGGGKLDVIWVPADRETLPARRRAIEASEAELAASWDRRGASTAERAESAVRATPVDGADGGVGPELREKLRQLWEAGLDMKGTETFLEWRLALRRHRLKKDTSGRWHWARRVRWSGVTNPLAEVWRQPVAALGWEQQRTVRGGRRVWVSLLLPAMAAVVAGGWAGRSLEREARRRRAGLRVECGYDLRESGGRCPECGAGG